MDPNTAWKEYLEILKHLTTATGPAERELMLRAYELRVDLLNWLDTGGFEPKWKKNERLLFLVRP